MLNKMATASCDLARSRHEHEFALLEGLSGGWRSRGRARMELERFVRLDWPWTENESQFLSISSWTIDTSTLSSTPFCCAVNVPL